MKVARTAGRLRVSSPVDHRQEPSPEAAGAAALLGDSPAAPRASVGRKGSTDFSSVALYFDRPIHEAAKQLDICTTVLKKICRRHGLKRWPSRRLKSIDKQVALLRTVTDDERFDGDRATRAEISEQLALLQAERARICSPS